MNNSSIFVVVWMGFCCFPIIYIMADTNSESNNQYEKYPALILNLNNFNWSGIRHIPFITACPASTQMEQKFNEEVSITGNSFFLQKLYRVNDSVSLDFCDKPIKPATVYNIETDEYEIGYELYYEKEMIKRKDQRSGFVYSMLGTKYWFDERSRVKLEDADYHRYKPLNINNQIRNQSKLLNTNQFILEHQKNTNSNFIFTDGSSRMAFYWISALRIASEGYNRQIVEVDDEDGRIIGERKIIATVAGKGYDLQSKCEDFVLNNKEPKLCIFSKNEGEILKTELNSCSAQWKSFGGMTMSQIIPLWYYDTFFGQLASCADMNMVPIWTSIAEGQLKTVDLYLQAVKNKLKCDKIEQMVFGVAGILTPYEGAEDDKLYAFDENNSRNIPVPKLIYRVIEAECNTWYDEYEVYNAIIVIHNDPSGVWDDDRICQEGEELSGWDKIKNDDPTTGLTYVCQYRTKKVISNDLGISIKDKKEFYSQPLELNSIPKRRGFASDEFSVADNTPSINSEFEKLLNQTL